MSTPAAAIAPITPPSHRVLGMLSRIGDPGLVMRAIAVSSRQRFVARQLPRPGQIIL
jgi:hypothetical protein